MNDFDKFYYARQTAFNIVSQEPRREIVFIDDADFISEFEFADALAFDAPPDSFAALRGRSVALPIFEDLALQVRAYGILRSLPENVDVKLLDLRPFADVTETIANIGVADLAPLLECEEAVDKERAEDQFWRLAPLAAVVHAFQRRLHMPDLIPLLATLAAFVANYLDGDAVWLMIVGGSSGGKSEILNSLSGQANVFATSTLTEPSLLSGSSKSTRTKSSTGGLLHKLGAFGIILVKDFGSILAMNRDKRSELLAALREIYDGNWVRHLGVDGGQTLAWSGKVGMLAAATPAIDRAHAANSALGERFVYVRLNATEEKAQARQALVNTGHEAEIRDELSGAVDRLFDSIDLERNVTVSEADLGRLTALAMLAARCRSAVERDGYQREIVSVPPPESPARLAKILAQLRRGLQVIEVPADLAWEVLIRVAFDSMPQIRREVFLQIAASRNGLTVEEMSYHQPAQTVRRAAQDLSRHRVLVSLEDERQLGIENRVANVTVWNVSAWAKQLYEQAMGEG